jgi:hypothetical protein
MGGLLVIMLVAPLITPCLLQEVMGLLKSLVARVVMEKKMMVVAWVVIYHLVHQMREVSRVPCVLKYAFRVIAVFPLEMVITQDIEFKKIFT